MGIFRKIVRWLLFLVSGLLILSGYGIVKYRIVTELTLGYLDKAQSFRLHEQLALPFIILLLLHVLLPAKLFRGQDKSQ